MNLRDARRAAALTLLLTALASPAARAQDAPPVTLAVGARLQLRFTYVDTDADGAMGSFTVPRARLMLSGVAYERFAYTINTELGGGAARLLDANVRYTLAPPATIWLGQGRVPFSRQFQTSSGSLQFVDRSLAATRFAPPRQLGVALTGGDARRRVEYAAGIYNGSGPNAPNDNDRYMLVARAVLTPFGAYAPVESAHDYPATPRLALGAAALRNTLGAGEERVDIVRYGVETAFKWHGFNAVAEYFTEHAEPVAGEFETVGGYVQLGYLLPARRDELAGRYGVISPRGDHTGAPVAASGDVVEYGIAWSHYLSAHRAKLQTDVLRIERRGPGTRDVQLRVQLQLAM